MKRSKVLSVILCIAMLLTIITPAAGAMNTSGVSLSDVYTNGNIAMYGFEDAEKLYNFSVDTQAMTGDFAVVYHNSPNYLYEYQFELPAGTTDIHTLSFWENLASLCFSNASSWNRVYIPAVIAVQHFTEPNVATIASDSHTQYFTNYLEDLYGAEYMGTILSSSNRGNTKLHLRTFLQYYVYKDATFTANKALSVVSFITGIIGVAATNAFLGLISAITGGVSLIPMGASIDRYKLRANWRRYVTVNNDDYPYSLADKLTFLSGYVYSETGYHDVDPSSATTDYVPSSSYFNSTTDLFNDAYDAYLGL